MTESLWNRYDISRKTPEVPVKRSPKVVRKDRELALNEPLDYCYYYYYYYYRHVETVTIIEPRHEV